MSPTGPVAVAVNVPIWPAVTIWVGIKPTVGADGSLTVTLTACAVLVSWVLVSVAVTSMVKGPLTLAGGCIVTTPVLATIEAHVGEVLLRLYCSARRRRGRWLWR